MMNELTDWLALWHVPGIGPATFNSLIHHFGSPGEALRASRDRLRQVGLPDRCLGGILSPDLEGVNRDLQWAQQPNHYIITIDQPSYPALLREIVHPPPLLYVHGNLIDRHDAVCRGMQIYRSVKNFRNG